MLGNSLARNMHQKTLIKMEIQEMEKSNHSSVKGDGNTLLQFLWAKHEQRKEVDHPCAIKCTKFVMLTMTSNSGMKHMNETPLVPTLHMIIPMRPAVNPNISHFTLPCHGKRSRPVSKMRSGLITS